MGREVYGCCPTPIPLIHFNMVTVHPSKGVWPLHLDRATILKYTTEFNRLTRYNGHDRNWGWQPFDVHIQTICISPYATSVLQYDCSYRPRPPTACNCSPISRQSAPVVRQRSSSAWPSRVSDPWGRTVWPKPATPQATDILWYPRRDTSPQPTVS